MYGENEISKLLIASSAEVDVPNRDGDTPLHLAARKGLKEIVELLIVKGVDINANDGSYTQLTPLKLAVQEGHKEVAELLRKHGATE